MSADGTRRPPQGALGEGPAAQEESPGEGAGLPCASRAEAPPHDPQDLQLELRADPLPVAEFDPLAALARVEARMIGLHRYPLDLTP